MDGGDAVLVGELAHKTKPADTASETSSLPEQKGFRGFVLLDTQDFTGEPKKSIFFFYLLYLASRTATDGSEMHAIHNKSYVKKGEIFGL